MGEFSTCTNSITGKLFGDASHKDERRPPFHTLDRRLYAAAAAAAAADAARENGGSGSGGNPGGRRSRSGGKRRKKRLKPGRGHGRQPLSGSPKRDFGDGEEKGVF